MTENQVEIRGLTLGYEGVCVFENLDLDIPKGVMGGILGANGSGKTSLIKAMLSLLKPVAGEITFPNLPPKSIAYVPQNDLVDWHFPATVLDVVTMGTYGQLGWFRPVGKKQRSQAMDALEKMGMAEYHKRQIHQLSGGQRQRVFLARALVQKAWLYLLDEPFKGVDAPTEACLVAQLKALQQEGKTILVVHHDHQTVAEYFQWLALCQGGKVISGSTEEIFPKGGR